MDIQVKLPPVTISYYNSSDKHQAENLVALIENKLTNDKYFRDKFESLMGEVCREIKDNLYN